MQAWQLQEAKARLSEVIQKAINEGPQDISLRGRPAAMILSHADYEMLTRPKPSFTAFLRDSPLHGVELEWEPDTALTREVGR
ncbi:prevent-host-death protein [Sulfuricella denitrificans skB26]|uniref:Antitoxin n=1 Tax=Sulfuricella denitrificans (strain DSM 22764 / NBRC 105220 / skB26) TaxID=1163617 RepID=S6A9D4_SULDS|nr:type II toxin-antitoxin system Phd/YefM family antitoxin [Sulfuricella denitrificans]BAN33915.1 prevent-host-death protein [Sulfuricella denitrificans skB26]